MATIIDADGHLLEPPSIWEEYTEPAYREQVIQIAKDREGIDCLKINGELRRDRNMAIAAACTPGGLSDPHKARTMSWDDIVPGGYDPHVRVQDMDLEGIEVSFFYPTLWLIYGDLTGPRSRQRHVGPITTGWQISANPHVRNKKLSVRTPSGCTIYRPTPGRDAVGTPLVAALFRAATRPDPTGIQTRRAQSGLSLFQRR